MSELKTSEVLDLAADKIEVVGWGTGVNTWENRDGAGLCLEGGIIAALGRSFTPGTENFIDTPELWACPAYVAMASYLETRAELWRWNDAQGRTAEEVVEVLRAAAAVERAKEESLERSAVTA